MKPPSRATARQDGVGSKPPDEVRTKPGFSTSLSDEFMIFHLSIFGDSPRYREPDYCRIQPVCQKNSNSIRLPKEKERPGAPGSCLAKAPGPFVDGRGFRGANWVKVESGDDRRSRAGPFASRTAPCEKSPGNDVERAWGGENHPIQDIIFQRVFVPWLNRPE